MSDAHEKSRSRARRARSTAGAGAGAPQLTHALISSALAHEVKQPLNAIGLNVELLRRRVHPEGANMLDAVQRAAEKIQASLDAFARVFAPPTISEEVLDLRAVLAQVAGVEHDLPDELPECAAGVEPLQLALAALIENARLASPASGRIVLCARADEIDLHISVIDCGCGMSAEIARRAPEIGFSTWGRAGLGVTLAKFVAYHHGGSFVMKSAPDKGTTVTLSLPLSGD